MVFYAVIGTKENGCTASGCDGALCAECIACEILIFGGSILKVYFDGGFLGEYFGDQFVGRNIQNTCEFFDVSACFICKYGLQTFP